MKFTSNNRNPDQFASSTYLSGSVISTTRKNISNTSADINVDALFNSSQIHSIKKGAGIHDSLPGIINRFG